MGDVMLRPQSVAVTTTIASSLVVSGHGSDAIPSLFRLWKTHGLILKHGLWIPLPHRILSHSGLVSHFSTYFCGMGVYTGLLIEFGRAIRRIHGHLFEVHLDHLGRPETSSPH